jgi:hypothetical protein
MPLSRGSSGAFWALQATPEVPTRKLLRVDSGALDWA